MSTNSSRSRFGPHRPRQNARPKIIVGIATMAAMFDGRV